MVADHAEWNLTADLVQKDFIRNLVVIEGRLIVCTNLGNLNLIETDRVVEATAASTSSPVSASTAGSGSGGGGGGGVTTKDNQKLLFKSILLSNYTVMSKIKVKDKWILAIGTLKGFSSTATTMLSKLLINNSYNNNNKKQKNKTRLFFV